MIVESSMRGARIARLDADRNPVGELELAVAARLGLRLEAVSSGDEAALAERVRGCAGVLVVSSKLPAPVIAAMDACRVIARYGIGTDRIDVAAATAAGIVVANVPDFCNDEMGDHAMALILALARRLPQMHAAFAAGAWGRARALASRNRRLAGQVLGLVGFGNSAKALARRAVACGMRVVATRRRRVADADAERLGVEMIELPELLRGSDWVSLHLPLSADSRMLIDRDALRAMKPGACLINTARGALVDEVALAEALRDGHLGGAGIDTFALVDPFAAPELPPQHPLLGLDQVVLTPHVAAYSREASRDCVLGGLENLTAVLGGRWPRPDRVVDPRVVPRAPLGAHDPALARELELAAP
jgi:D-3-phosphoglycerate dehydrogenase